MSNLKSYLTTSAIVILSLSTQTAAFAFHQNPTLSGSKERCTSTTQLYGLFDGIKEAFVAPALERSTLDAERETPIDRWMGWNVKSSDDTPTSMGTF